jgi:ADP-ribose pyrophosphatase YjhB (NUDIX family)
MSDSTAWLAWARELYSLAQAGLTYSQNEYDLERYRRLLEIAAEMTAGQGGLPLSTVQESFSMQGGYATPKIDVRAAVLRDSKILLVQERADGKWSLPGGWADVGEAPAAMAAREVREESGFEVKAVKLAAVYDANRLQPLEFYHSYKLVFLCALLGGEPRPSHETPAVDFFDPLTPPPLSLSRTDERMLAEVLAHSRDPLRPAAFD